MTRLESNILCLVFTILYIIISSVWTAKCKRDLKRIRTKNKLHRSTLTDKILRKYEIGIAIIVFTLIISITIIGL